MSHALISVVFEGLGVVNCRQEPVDLVTPEGQVRIESYYTCISAGTELAKLDGRQPIKFPCTLGNRAVGRVVEHKTRRKDLHPGQLVFAQTPHASASVTSQLVAPLPEALARPEAALLGMALVALAGVQTARPELGRLAVVTGAGLVGQFAAQLLQLSGAEVVLLDPLEGRLDIARQCGVKNAWRGGPDETRERLLEFSAKKGADVVLECSGVPAVTLQALGLVRRGGTVIQVGSPRGRLETDITPLLQAVHLWRAHGDVTLKGAHEWKVPLYPTEHTRHSQLENVAILAKYMQSGALCAQPLLSAVYRPAEAAAAYSNLQEQKDKVLGAVFDWTSCAS